MPPNLLTCMSADLSYGTFKMRRHIVKAFRHKRDGKPLLTWLFCATVCVFIETDISNVSVYASKSAECGS